MSYCGKGERQWQAALAAVPATKQPSYALQANAWGVLFARSIREYERQEHGCPSQHEVEDGLRDRWTGDGRHWGEAHCIQRCVDPEDVEALCKHLQTL